MYLHISHVLIRHVVGKHVHLDISIIVQLVLVVVMLEEYGIQASAGSACNTGQTRLSHVIQAIHVPEEYAAGTVRFTIGYDNTMEEMNYVIQALEECVKLLRK